MTRRSPAWSRQGIAAAGKAIVYHAIEAKETSMRLIRAVRLFLFGHTGTARSIRGGQGHYAETQMPAHYGT